MNTNRLTLLLVALLALVVAFIHAADPVCQYPISLQGQECQSTRNCIAPINYCATAKDLTKTCQPAKFFIGESCISDLECVDENELADYGVTKCLVGTDNKKKCMFLGKGENDACEANEQCLSGRCTNNVCVSPKEGESCAAGLCPPDLVCFNAKCTKMPSTVGANCTTICHNAADTLFCDQTLLEGKCFAKLATGANCTNPDSCLSGQCRLVNGVGKCVDYSTFGEACSAQNPCDPEADYECIGGYCETPRTYCNATSSCGAQEGCSCVAGTGHGQCFGAGSAGIVDLAKSKDGAALLACTMSKCRSYDMGYFVMFDKDNCFYKNCKPQLEAYVSGMAANLKKVLGVPELPDGSIFTSAAAASTKTSFIAFIMVAIMSILFML